MAAVDGGKWDFAVPLWESVQEKWECEYRKLDFSSHLGIGTRVIGIAAGVMGMGAAVMGLHPAVVRLRRKPHPEQPLRPNPPQPSAQNKKRTGYPARFLGWISLL
ncbi:hypothetical protein C6I21_09125 [Alkalicoccus urumqiensis]|uniref:Uncharacterized protein n=1 Tax=Alkalicoccus urumqiensis TaxID=1548213 RepID=A0A2P6MHC9_ALKUR|nr:hypothetical protein C6I21_09125 [Alkalicoccus urumqiensis]